MEFLTKVSEAVAAGALLAILGFIWKIVRMLLPLQDYIKKTDERLETSETRLDMNDMLWSQELNQPIQTEALAKGHMNFPRKSKNRDL